MLLNFLLFILVTLSSHLSVISTPTSKTGDLFIDGSGIGLDRRDIFGESLATLRGHLRNGLEALIHPGSDVYEDPHPKGIRASRRGGAKIEQFGDAVVKAVRYEKL